MCRILIREQWGGYVMSTNLDLDDRLLEQAKIIGKHKTKKAAVTEALQEYIQKRKQNEVTKVFGSIEYDESYDYKQQRKKP
jgi:hypothetical protein